MCMGDWRLGRLMSIRQRSFAPIAGQETFPASRQRVGILLSGESGDDTTVVKVQFGLGTVMSWCPLQTGPFMFSLDRHGPVIQKEWIIVTSGADLDSITVWEYFLPEEVLSAGIEQFYSAYNIRPK